MESEILTVNCLKLNELTQNSRFYSTEAIQKAIDSIDLSEDTFHCCLKKQRDLSVDLSDITHIVTSLKIIGNDLVAEMRSVDTPANSYIVTKVLELDSVGVALQGSMHELNGNVSNIKFLYLYFK